MNFFKELFTKHKVTVFKSNNKLEAPPAVEKVDKVSDIYDMYSGVDTTSNTQDAEALSQELEYQSRRYQKELVL